MTKEDHSHSDQRTSAETRIVRWRCLNCGQTYFTPPDETPPDMCDYCRDMTTWKRVLTPVDRPERRD